MAYPDTAETLGSIAGYSVQIRRRVATAGDTAQVGPITAGAFVTTASLVKDGQVSDIVVFRDGSAAEAAHACKAAMSAFAAIGAQVTLGTPQAPLTGAGGSGPISRSVPLTPGTPLPPSRKVFIPNGSKGTLVLAGGGTHLWDMSGNGGDGLGVGGGVVLDVSAVDATGVTAPTPVQFLY